jgi:hypothetical protein
VIIDVGLYRNNYSLIPTTAIRRRLKLLDGRTDSQTKLGGPVDNKMVKVDNILIFYFWVVLIGHISISIFIIYSWM